MMKHNRSAATQGLAAEPMAQDRNALIATLAIVCNSLQMATELAAIKPPTGGAIQPVDHGRN